MHQNRKNETAAIAVFLMLSQRVLLTKRNIKKDSPSVHNKSVRIVFIFIKIVFVIPSLYLLEPDSVPQPFL